MRRALTLFVFGALWCGCTASVTIGSDDARVYADGGPVLIRDTSFPCSSDFVALSGSRVCSSFVWNGSDCIQTYGCTCTGDCTLPRPTYVACMALHGSCWSSSCSDARFCPNGFFCERGSCGESVGTCMAVPSDCSTTTASPTCGCDGIAYRSPCEALRAMQTLVPTPTCGVCNLPSITLAPGCSTSLGWAWNGSRCIEQLGCSCTGACDRLEITESTCLSRYQASCGGYFPCGNVSCVRGMESCRLGTGGGCMPLSGCSPAACSCVMLSAGDTCSDDSAGAIVITPP